MRARSSLDHPPSSPAALPHLQRGSTTAGPKARSASCPPPPRSDIARQHETLELAEYAGDYLYYLDGTHACAARDVDRSRKPDVRRHHTPTGSDASPERRDRHDLRRLHRLDLLTAPARPLRHPGLPRPTTKYHTADHLAASGPRSPKAGCSPPTAAPSTPFRRSRCQASATTDHFAHPSTDWAWTAVAGRHRTPIYYAGATPATISRRLRRRRSKA